MIDYEYIVRTTFTVKDGKNLLYCKDYEVENHVVYLNNVDDDTTATEGWRESMIPLENIEEIYSRY